MTIRPFKSAVCFLTAACLLACGHLLVPRNAGAESIPAPESLVKKNIDEKTDPIEIANSFLGIPYRNDGVLDDQGRFVLFEDQDKDFGSAGLNCSGFLVSVSRYIFKKNIAIDTAKKDRLGDSGKESELGDSWDFGWDLIFNLTEGMDRLWVMPEGKTPVPESADGLSLVGFPLQDEEAWAKAMDRMEPGYAYLGSFSKPTRKTGSKLLHYHVALFLLDEKGAVWMYQTTHNGTRLYRLRMNTPAGMARFKKSFTSSRVGPKNILILEVKIPDLPPKAEDALPDSGATE